MLHHLITSLFSFLSLVDVSHALPFLLATAPIAAPSGGSDGADDSDDDSGSEPPADFKAVGDAILAGMTDEERNRPFAGAGDDDDDDDQGAAAAPAASAVDDDDEGDGGAAADEEDTDLEGRAAVDEAGAGKPKNSDAKKEGDEDEGEGDEQEVIKVVLPGLADRGEEDVEIEVDDPAVADRLRRLKNDGLRAREYQQRRGELEAREAKLEAYEEAMEIDPISFHLERLPVDQQIAVARALIVEHLDVLQPEIDKYIEDPKARSDARVEQMKAQRKSAAQLEQSRVVKSHVQKCVRAVEKLIPEGTDNETVAEFMNDARQQMAAAARRGERVGPDTVASILSRKIKLYGFDQKPAARPAPSAGKKPAAAAAAEPPRAKPVNDKARTIADKGKAPAKPVAPQARVRRTQAARNAGSKVAPAGAGAAPVQLPAVPAEAESDVASMSKHLRGQGLPESWSSGAE